MRRPDKSITNRPHHVLQGTGLGGVPREVSPMRRWQGLAQHVQQPDGHLHLHERSALPVSECTTHNRAMTEQVKNKWRLFLSDKL